MSILPITLYGDEVLKKKTKEVKNIDGKLHKLIEDMYETMYNANGVGLAANQVGAGLSLFIVDASPIEDYSKVKPFVMINPKIVEVSEEDVIHEEGCLSLPNIKSDVVRPMGIKVVYYDINQKELTMERDDFVARIIQHEYDHLQGIYFTDRLEEEEKKLLKRSLKKIRQRSMDFEYPVTMK